MNCRFHPEAQLEFEQAITHYEECEEGLGYDFAIEIHNVIQNIVDLPMAWPELEPGVRRCLTRRFPFGILYAEEGSSIFILAVMHLHREPDYWKERNRRGDAPA